MGVLDAFRATWSSARETFGQGTPQDGTQFDGSSKLQQMKQGVEAAAPDGRWQGPASEAYAAENREHAAVYGKLADLDKRMAAEVTHSANVVVTGRQNLDNVSSWVTSMANAIPADASATDRDRKLLSIANEGISKVSDIIKNSNDAMSTIGRRVQTIKSEYEALTDPKSGSTGDTPKSSDKKPIVQMAAWDSNGIPETIPDLGGQPQDPANPFVGDSRYGHWETVPYSPNGPDEPLKSEYRPFEDDMPAKLGGTTGFYTPGKNWADPDAPPYAQWQEAYRFRIAGQEATTITRVVTVNGETRVERWVQNVYEYQRNTRWLFGGPVNNNGGDIGGLPPIVDIDQNWKPITIQEIAGLSGKNQTVTYYVPDGCGGQIPFRGAVPVGGLPDWGGTSDVPIATRPR